ncbi:MAG: hypothetical protein JO141_27790, partial [Bradyrhizobium sp.]|nr:hypothetical protein [Bradyrhizobium sp.]
RGFVNSLQSFVGALRKIDAVCHALSLIKNIRNKQSDAVCTLKHHLPRCFAQMTGEIRDISAKSHDALQQFSKTCVFFVIACASESTSRRATTPHVIAAAIFLLRE